MNSIFLHNLIERVSEIPLDRLICWFEQKPHLTKLVIWNAKVKENPIVRQLADKKLYTSSCEAEALITIEKELTRFWCRS